MRFCSMTVTISSSGVSSTIVSGPGVMTSPILRPCVRTYSVAKRPWPRESSSQLGSAPQKISFRHDADKLARGIEHRKAADPIQDHELRRLKYGGIELYRHDISGHHINRFHC
jgi:hypothetical protein